MEFGGRYRLEAPRVLVWQALNDVDVLGPTIPGCQSLNWTAPDTLALEIRANFGVVHPVFKGELRLSNVEPAVRYTLSGRGKGGLLFHAEGAADITLSDAGEGATELAFVAHGGGSGQLMKLGQALIGSSAQRVIDGFFARFADVIGVSITPLPR